MSLVYIDNNFPFLKNVLSVMWKCCESLKMGEGGGGVGELARPGHCWYIARRGH